MKISLKQSLKSRAMCWMPALLATAALMLSGAPPVWADDDHDSRDKDRDEHGDKVGIVPARYRGKTYGEWAATWWQWVYSIPSARNPLTDLTGAFAQEGQNGPVFFLAGTQGGGDPVVRKCTVPEGKALFFPLYNFNWVQFSTDDYYTTEQLREILKPLVDNPGLLSCEIDGKAVRDLPDFRVQSPVFSVTIPDNSLLPLPAGTYAPCVDDGYYLMLEPLKKGRHTIHFKATKEFHYPDHPDWDWTLSVDVTYHLTVKESKH